MELEGQYRCCFRFFCVCLLCVVALSSTGTFIHALKHVNEALNQEADQKWGYVTVRPGAHMFWWLYYTTNQKGYKNRPLVIWLQGGPGASSTGFGNFEEIGPLDVSQKPRNTSWVSRASVLFIDNPVGTGFSYVDSESAYTTDVHMIATDLVSLAKSFFRDLPDFQKAPLYIFSESYGGKMTAAFGQALYKAMKSGAVPCNLQGVALGDSWISPIDYVLTWAPFLFSTSLVDKEGSDQILEVAHQCKAALEAGDYKKSTELWQKTEDVANNVTGGVNFYNILDWNPGYSPASSASSNDHLKELHRVHVSPLQNDNLANLMNGPIKKKLGIPDNVTWGGQSGGVFSYQSGDFMKPVVDIVDDLLNNTDLNVVVYNGQLDLICDTMGTELWMSILKWPGIEKFQISERKQLKLPGQAAPWGYLKQYKNLSFFWVLNAGHMVPLDVGEAMLNMLSMIIH